MELTNMIPKESSFYLRTVDRNFTMHPINLSDEIWLDETYGSNIESIFEKVDIKEISRIIFRLLKDEDRQFFIKRDVTLVNEAGDKSTIQLGGIDLLQSLISGWDEKNDLLKALLENIGHSRSELDEIEKEDKKKVEMLNQ